MTHFALICPPVPGHLNPMTALGRALKRRGHRVTLIGFIDVAPVSAASGLEFLSFGANYLGMGALTPHIQTVGRLLGHRASVHTTRLGLNEIDVQLAEIPALIKKAGIDALVVDKASAAGGTIAELCALPFVTTMGAYMPDLTSDAPPMCFGWHHRSGPLFRWRNSIGNLLLRSFALPHLMRLNANRRRLGLKPYRQPADWASPLLQLCPIPKAFELPRDKAPMRMAYPGPFLTDGGGPSDADTTGFPFERLTGRPLIYASLGTLHTGRPELYQAIIAATANLGVQVVLSYGNGATPTLAAEHVLAVRHAPQRDILRRASLTITHGGLNTVMESLAAGVPLVVLPLANDQPGVGERVRYHGVGVVVDRRSAATKLATAVRQVLGIPEFTQRAQSMSRIIASGGEDHAAALIDHSIST